MNAATFGVYVQRYELLDWALIVLLGVVALILNVAVQPHCRPFSWDDASIARPHLPDIFPDYSVGLAAALLVALVVLCSRYAAAPLHARVAVPLCRVLRCGLPPNTFEQRYEQPMPSGAPLASWLRLAGFSLSLDLFVGTVAKLYAGRLRPDYLARLELAGFTASTPSAPDPRHDAQFYCKLHLSNRLLRDGRLSFPSGHSSTSFDVSTLAALFLFTHLRPAAGPGSLTRLLISLAPYSFGLTCAISRTRDYHHNFSDILGGAVLGLICPLLAFRVLFRAVGGRTGAYVARDAEHHAAFPVCAQERRELDAAPEIVPIHGSYSEAAPETAEVPLAGLVPWI